MELTEHFTWEEATRTHVRSHETGLPIPNEPGPDARAALKHTFAEMERVRALLGGRSIDVHSAFRSHIVNALVGGAEHSQHERGEAIDFTVKGMTIREAFLAILGSELPFDQLIEEAGSWVHVSFVSGRPPRLQSLTMRVVKGRAKYEPFRLGKEVA